MDEHGALPQRASWSVREIRGDNEVLWGTYDICEEALNVVDNFYPVFGFAGYVRPFRYFCRR